MKREWLKGLGITDEQIDMIMKENGNDIENAKSTVKQSYKEIESENKSLNDAIKAKDAEISKIKIDNAVEKALTENKAINAKAVAPFLNLDGVEIAEDGKLVACRSKNLIFGVVGKKFVLQLLLMLLQL